MLLTSGMSDQPLNVPDSSRSLTELSLCLPPEWPMSERALEDDRNYWPIGLMRMLAHLPHLFGCGVWASDVIPNYNPPEPYSENTCLCATMLTPQLRLPAEFGRLDFAGDAPGIAILEMLPLLDDEAAFQREHGAPALLRRFETARHSGLINPYRPSVVPVQPQRLRKAG